MRAGRGVARRCGVVLAFGATLTGCPGGGALEDAECHGSGGCEASGGGSSIGACDGTIVLATSCHNGPFCHASSTEQPPTGGVEFATPPAGMTLGESLYNRPATHPATVGCTSSPPELIINASEPAKSLLLTKITGTAGVDFACGVSMPPGTPPLAAKDIACLTEWVNSIVASGGI